MPVTWGCDAGPVEGQREAGSEDLGVGRVAVRRWPSGGGCSSPARSGLRVHLGPVGPVAGRSGCLAGAGRPAASRAGRRVRGLLPGGRPVRGCRWPPPLLRVDLPGDCGRRCRRGPRSAGVVDRAGGTDWHVVNRCRGQWPGHHVGAGDARHGKGRPVWCARHGGLQLHRIHRRCPRSPRSGSRRPPVPPLAECGGLPGPRSARPRRCRAGAVLEFPRVDPAAVDDPIDSQRRAGVSDWDPRGGACSGSPGCSRSMLVAAGW